MLAMPAQKARKPTQLTAVPVNANVARAPVERLNAAVASLQSRLRLPKNQPGGAVFGSPDVYVMARSVSSNRVAVGSVGGAALLTVTVTGDEVAGLPAASRARAVRV